MASLPFLSCKFFAKQKTYETTVAGIHAAASMPAGYRHLALAMRRFFPQNPRLFFVILNCCPRSSGYFGFFVGR
jgi:hypothetical protein